jgi:LysM repeat protein
MEDYQATSPLQNPAISLMLAAAGTLLAVVALIVAITAKSSSAELEKKMVSMQASVDSVVASAESVQVLAKRIEGIDKTSDQISLKMGEMDRNIRSLAEQTQAAINALTADIAKGRKSTPASSGKASGDASEAVAAGQYKIQKGDTLASVAKRLGISLNDLTAANPNVDSRYLKVGQVINAPKK